MSEHFRSYSAIFPLIFKTDGDKTKILLHRRKNTGYQDGKWDIAGSGHIDEGETAKMAVIRECKEELSIEVQIEDLTFAHLSHRLSDRTYYDIYFVINKYNGVPAIMEPNKCSELNWFDIDRLPSDIIACRKFAIQEYKKKNKYSELVESSINE